MKLWLVPFVVVSGFAQTSDVPYAPNSDGPGLTFTTKQVRNCYPGSFSSVRTVNFRSLNFQRFGTDGKPSGYALKNGHFQLDAKFDHYSTDLDSIHYLPAADSLVGEAALVILSWFEAAGSSSQGGKKECKV